MEDKMSSEELIKRYILFVISLFVMGIGVSLTKHGEMGVSPISSLANVLSLKFTEISFGNWLIITNFIMILGQVIMLGKKFKLIELMQIPISFIFGYCADLGMFLVGFIPNDTYIIRLLLVFAGIIVLGFGITLGVVANVLLNCGEAFVKTISEISKKDFGTVRIIVDISCVTLSIILSLIFFNGHVLGTREGTIISAFCVGLVVKFFTPILKKALNGFLKR